MAPNYHIDLQQSPDGYKMTLLHGAETLLHIEGAIALGGSIVSLHIWEGTMENEAANAMVAARLADMCLGLDADLMLELTEARLPLADLFFRHGFKVHSEKFLFWADLTKDYPTPRIPLELQHYSLMPEAQYAALFHASLSGEPGLGAYAQMEPMAHWKAFVAAMDTLLVPEWVYAVSHQQEHIGILQFREVRVGERRVGFMNYIGLHPDFRGRGWGIEVHRLGLQKLQQLGCTEYIGSTHGENQVMQAVMRHNGMVFKRKQINLRPN